VQQFRKTQRQLCHQQFHKNRKLGNTLRAMKDRDLMTELQSLLTISLTYDQNRVTNSNSLTVKEFLKSVNIW